MSAAFIAVLVSLGVATWVYDKLRNKTGYGNNRSAVIGAAVVFVLAFIVIFSLSHMILK